MLADPRAAPLLAAIDEVLTRPSARERLQGVAEVLVDAYVVERCIIGKVAEDTVEAIAGVGMGIAAEPRFNRLPSGRGIVGRAARLARSQRVDDVLQDPDYFAAAVLTRSELAVPIVRRGRALGVLNLESNRLAAFTDEDLGLLEEVAKVLARRAHDVDL